jgi:Ca-activated chloride channel family protein
MNQKNKNSYFIILFFLSINIIYAQKEKMILRDGNESYYGGKPIEAGNYYKKSLDKKPDYYKANFNLGDALYKTAELIRVGKIPVPDKQMKPDSAANIVFEQAAQQFEVVAKASSSPDTVQKAWHNYGNSKLQQKSYDDAILGYKKALRINPKDEDTRYNLAYALKQKKEQQNQNQQNQQQQQQQQQNQDKNEEKKEDEKKQEQQPQQQQMSKEQAEQMLNALKNSEKKIQALRKKKGDPSEKLKIEKDW